MKVIIRYLFIICFVGSSHAGYSQGLASIGDNGDDSEFKIIAQKGDNSRRIQHIYEGDKVFFKSRNNEKYRGTLTNIRKYHIELDSAQTILIDSIARFKRINPEFAHILVGTAMIIGGGVVLLPVLAGSVDFQWIVPQGGIGLGLITAGAMIIAPPTYKLEKGDQLIIK